MSWRCGGVRSLCRLRIILGGLALGGASAANLLGLEQAHNDLLLAVGLDRIVRDRSTSSAPAEDGKHTALDGARAHSSASQFSSVSMTNTPRKRQQE